MKMEAFPPVEGNYNLKNYEEMYQHFNWKEAEKNFSWNKTGKINAAYELIDRHAESSRKHKVALYYLSQTRNLGG